MLPVWMPGAGFKREALRVRGMVQAMMDAPYEMVRGAMVRGFASVRVRSAYGF